MALCRVFYVKKWRIREMTTPTKERIIEEAFNINARQNHNINLNTPTESELKENGTFNEARISLMQNRERHEALNYLEKMASEFGFELVKTKNMHAYAEDLEDYPIEDILKYCAFATGGRHSGKTNLLKLIVSEALRAKVEVKVFDPSLQWKTFPLKHVKVIPKRINESCSWNTIYDISRLSVLEARDYVSAMLENDLTESIHLTDISKKPKALVVLEEVQNIIPSHSLRSKKYLEISRFVTQGRNFGLSFIASTQRLASVDINLIEISGVRYWFKLEGARNLTKARYWLSKYHAWRLRQFERGRCYLQFGSRIKLLRLPKFRLEEVYAK